MTMPQRGAVAAAAVGLAAALAVADVRASSLPTWHYQEASGCGGLTLYAWNAARTEVLIVRINQERVSLANGETELSITPASADVQVRVEVTDAPRDDFPYCSGEPSSGAPPVTWPAASGRVKLILKRRPQATISAVSVQLDRLVLTGPDGTESRQRRPVRFAAAIADPIK